jgi:phosphate starvation-inducible PhoH-like protein
LSFNNRTIIIADELQNATPAQVKALVTRCETGAQLIGAGDKTQSALKGMNGLAMLEDVLQRYPHKDAQVVHFTPQDNCRSGISGHLANAFEKEGTW